MTLKLMTYQPSGASAAVQPSGLPEKAGAPPISGGY